ncbi:MAG TPA: DUF4382 domain-containing protein [Gemmatimonadaceae bacterium]|jgi:hypothetical protein|nr:DUF4382 domain-containing protein [Gemmatimonadaceae bacterium]
MGSRAAVVGSLAVFGLVVACSDSTSTNRAPAQIAFTSGISSTANALLVPLTSGGHTLNITQATLTITRVELKPTKTDACVGDNEAGDDNIVSASSSATSDDNDACEELKAGPLSVDLPLNGGITTLPANAIPAGTFREIELQVSTARVVGTFDGTPFDVTVPVNTRGEIEFATPLVVADGTPTSVTINVPVGGWLTNADGSLVDPSKISSNATLLAQVRSRIIASFHAFEDEDHDGHDDHGGSRGPG